MIKLDERYHYIFFKINGNLNNQYPFSICGHSGKMFPPSYAIFYPLMVEHYCLELSGKVVPL